MARALARRAPLLDAGAGTDAVRLVHGEADGLPGLAVDRLGPAAAHARRRPRGAAAARARARGARRGAAAGARRRSAGGRGDAPARAAARRAGLRARSWRATRARSPSRWSCARARCASRWSAASPSRPARAPASASSSTSARTARGSRARAARGGRYLNLFAHTGGFSAALLAGGADEVWSVDLSGPYLAQLERESRAFGARRSSATARVRREARRFLAELEPGAALRRHRDRSAHRGGGGPALLERAPRPRAARRGGAGAARAGRLPAADAPGSGGTGRPRSARDAARPRASTSALAAIEPAPARSGFPRAARLPRRRSLRSAFWRRAT